MYSLGILALALIIVAVINGIVFNKIKNVKFPYIKKDYLLSRAEKEFYFVLQEAIKDDYLLFSKVRILDLFYLPKGMGTSRYYHYKNKIQSKHVDFLLCDKENIKPLLAIELDDSSHSRSDRILRDVLVDKIFEGANFPILHICTTSSYSSEDLLMRIKNSLNINNQAPIAS